MLKYCIEKWDKFHKILEENIKNDFSINSCTYADLISKVVMYVLNGDGKEWDASKITVIDNGDYQGTLLFLIPRDTYQPTEYEYLMTYVGYGSCSGCDTLQAIQAYNFDKKLTDTQLKAYMTLCKDIVCNIIKPYNCGWRCEEDFVEV